MATRGRPPAKTAKFSWKKLWGSIENEALRRTTRAGDICKLLPDARLRLMCRVLRAMGKKGYKLINEKRRGRPNKASRQ